MSCALFQNHAYLSIVSSALVPITIVLFEEEEVTESQSLVGTYAIHDKNITRIKKVLCRRFGLKGLYARRVDDIA